MSSKKTEPTEETKAAADEKPAEKTEAQQVVEARAARAASGEIAPGSVVNAVEGAGYAVFIAREYPVLQAEAMRKEFRRRGYVPATNGELLVGEPDAEIWRTSKAIADDGWKDEFIANLLSENWFQMQRRRPNHGIAKRVIEMAMKVHDPKVSPESRAAAKSALEAHVRATPIFDLQTRS